MTQVLQLLVIAASIVGLVIYGFIRDKQEHKTPKDDRQGNFEFSRQQDDEREHRGAAMSRL